jgi:hypothetical protein
MKNSIKTELAEHVLELIDRGTIHDDNIDEAHFHAFNEDYYIIGYYNAEQWLKKHDISAFEAIDTIVQYEKENFGETNTRVDNAESVVNMYVYIIGEELLYSLNYETIAELKDQLEEI